MATTTPKAATPATTTPKGKGKAAPTPTPTTTAKAQPGGNTRPVALPALVAPKVQTYVVGVPNPATGNVGWPLKAASGNSIRAYAYAVAVALQQAQGAFTLAQYKAALVAAAPGSTYTQPGGGWQGHNMPQWASHPNQQWLVPVGHPAALVLAPTTPKAPRKPKAAKAAPAPTPAPAAAPAAAPAPTTTPAA